ncbi:lysozyme [Serratia ficaria]|uniref:lysozyme n=1 Tax=Serratia ficaria TaxID=61651 RepID=UPI000E24097A|nr:lysozyme [Serratia ficaria]REF42104.1 lysozyme [Serratia ficaria]CAI1047967.1 Phage-related lysozyme (muraminidase) [Serratia ficaria]CAI1103023.1 Phage-related lysozyme (muraminidase) [Serratia ficaria]CAI1172685.1 Phage-related lysozyme (muraminidase) [Serratia ficaria]CAI1197935.1 Phage-related lysozyme (muraminidase) [Serratia ficaria]
MQTSNNGRTFIKGFESLELKAYPDPGTGGKPWTVGWGHTKGVNPGDQITQQQAEQFLSEDLAVFELTVNSAIKRPMTQNQFDAMVSLAFNIGARNFAQSTLVKKFNAGDVSGAADQFPRWKFSAGEVMPGLVRRRAAERELFLS